MIGLVGLLFFVSLNPTVASVIWSDDFNDGNYDGWTVGVGDWRVTDGELESYYVDVQSFPARIWHDSSVVEGTWSFDFTTAVDYSVFEHNFLFMGNGTDATVTYDGYGIRVVEDNVMLLKFNDGSTVPLFMATIDDMDSWAHVDITRSSSTGEIYVYVNATSSLAEPDISYVDTDYDYSESFVITHNKEGFRFDNIVVNDEILIDPIILTTSTTTTTNSLFTYPTTTTTTGTGGEMPTMLIIAGGGIAVVVIVLIYYKMRGS
jgi:hypothetical protein